MQVADVAAAHAQAGGAGSAGGGPFGSAATVLADAVSSACGVHELAFGQEMQPKVYASYGGASGAGGKRPGAARARRQRTGTSTEFCT